MLMVIVRACDHSARVRPVHGDRQGHLDHQLAVPDRRHPAERAARQLGGMGPAVVGTLEITALATVLAVPLGVLGAIYLNEYGGNRRWPGSLDSFRT